MTDIGILQQSLYSIGTIRGHVTSADIERIYGKGTDARSIMNKLVARKLFSSPILGPNGMVWNIVEDEEKKIEIKKEVIEIKEIEEEIPEEQILRRLERLIEHNNKVKFMPLMTVQEYLDEFGKLKIEEQDKVFVSDGVSFIGGSFKGYKKRGML